MAQEVPVKAEFNVGTYDDGSGPVVRVYYDSSSTHAPENIWLDGGEYSSAWFAFDHRFADDVCAAIKQAAAMLTARAGDQS